MDKKVKQYFLLKKKQKEIDQELNDLRDEILNYCAVHHMNTMETGNYTVKIIHKDRKEYDDNKAFEALPDPDVWRLLSKVDPAKVTSLIKMNVISEEILQDAVTLKKIASLHVEKK
jgi:hypothetical protein